MEEAEQSLCLWMQGNERELKACAKGNLLWVWVVGNEGRRTQTPLFFMAQVSEKKSAQLTPQNNPKSNKTPFRMEQRKHPKTLGMETFAPCPWSTVCLLGASLKAKYLLKCLHLSCKSTLFSSFKHRKWNGAHRTFCAGWSPCTCCPWQAGAKSRFDEMLPNKNPGALWHWAFYLSTCC